MSRKGDYIEGIMVMQLGLFVLPTNSTYYSAMVSLTSDDLLVYTTGIIKKDLYNNPRTYFMIDNHSFIHSFHVTFQSLATKYSVSHPKLHQVDNDS